MDMKEKIDELAKDIRAGAEDGLVHVQFIRQFLEDAYRSGQEEGKEKAMDMKGRIDELLEDIRAEAEERFMAYDPVSRVGIMMDPVPVSCNRCLLRRSKEGSPYGTQQPYCSFHMHFIPIERIERGGHPLWCPFYKKEGA